jgi:hypothetical protein
MLLHCDDYWVLQEHKISVTLCNREEDDHEKNLSNSGMSSNQLSVPHVRSAMANDVKRSV